MGMASRVLEKSGLNVFCRRRLLSSSGYWYCFSQIDSPAIGYVKDTAEYIDIINETQTAYNQQYN